LEGSSEIGTLLIYAILFFVCFSFQEIVPLNAGNVLGAEDNGPAKKWLSLIRKTLNNFPGTSGVSGCYTPSPIPEPIVEINADFLDQLGRRTHLSFIADHSRQHRAGEWTMTPQFHNHDSIDDSVFVIE